MLTSQTNIFGLAAKNLQSNFLIAMVAQTRRLECL